MNTQIKHIDEAIYDLGKDKVIKKKKSIIPFLAVFIAGAALVVISFLPAVKASENLYTGLMFVGWILAAVGLVGVFSILFGSGGRPYYVPTGEYLKRTERLYDIKHLDKVRECVSKGDFEQLQDLEEDSGTMVMAVSYKGRKSGVKFCQVFTYIPHNYEPVDKMHIFEKKGAKFAVA